MKKKILTMMICLLACCLTISAQEVQKSDLQKSAEAAWERRAPITSRNLYIKAFEDYFAGGKMKQGVECAAKASDIYVKESMYQEAFDLLYRVDQTIDAKSISKGEKAVMKAAFEHGYPVIYLQENGFAPLAKPGGARFAACAEGRLLILAPWPHHNRNLAITQDKCHALNDIARAICAGTLPPAPQP